MTGTSLITTMAARYEMDPQQFARTIRATVMPSQHTDDEFRAFMMVAYEYGLNPILRQIYAYSKKGGGINVVVSIDGWAHLVNTHPQFDGMEFSYEEQPTELGKPRDWNKPPVSCTCSMWRKDRRHPVMVTEYWGEVYRNTEPWNQYKRRMLRHKALMQCARIAFGYSGITDEDEARDVADSVKQIQQPIIVEAEALDEWAESADIPPSTGDSAPSPPSPEEPDDTAGAVAPTTAPADLRQEAIDKILVMVTDKSTNQQQKLENLTNLQPVYEDMLPADFAKTLLATAAKVAKGEQMPDKARGYLENLP
jgi:phage recombination protein Bet